MQAPECIAFLKWALPRLQMRWRGFRKVRKQVCKRIHRRLGELGLADMEAYRRHLEAHRDEWAILDGFCRIPISRFYRDRVVFDVIRDDVFPDLAGQARASGDRDLLCWSAGCASGEEIYTLSIIWKLSVGPRFPSLALRLIGTDSDPEMLERAERACYATSSLRDLPAEWRAEAFTPRDGSWSLRSEFREGVELRLQDIRRELPAERFRLVLCRNMAFTYFDDELQRRTLDRLVDKLAPGGILVTGKSEALPCRPARLEAYGPRLGLYRRI